MNKVTKLFLISLTVLTTIITGCSNESQPKTDKFVGIYFAAPKSTNYKPVEEVIITKENGKYYMECRDWEYEYSKIEGDNYTITPYFKLVPKTPIEINGNNITIPSGLGNTITLTYQEDNTLIGSNVGFGAEHQATYTKVQDKFTEYMKKAAEGTKNYYTSIGKNVTIDNSPLANEESKKKQLMN